MRQQLLQRSIRGITALFIPALIVTGCYTAPATLPVAPSPTAAVLPADLTALKTLVERQRADEEPLQLEEEDSVDIQPGDEIAVDRQGRAMLRFPEHSLQVELFRNSEALVQEARLLPTGSVVADLVQQRGHTRTELKATAATLVKVETAHATISNVVGNSEFLVCHGEELTCVVGLQGEARVEAQGKAVTIREGESTYVFPGQPPEPVICANLQEVEAWLGQIRGNEEVGPLGGLVINWPKEGCRPTLPPSPTPPEMDLPPSTDMAMIGGGPYMVGRPAADESHLAAQEIMLEEFWIDRYEVTNGQYQVFLDETGQSPSLNWAGVEDHPVQGVTWDDAVAYCAWAGKRIPSEAEWEAAARGPGPEPPLYPWGDDPTAGGQTDSLPRTETYPVGSQPFNQSAFEVYDMAGNVWEWVGEPYGPVLDGQVVLRGGRHGLLTNMAHRQQVAPDDPRFVPLAGFRCAADQVQGE